MARLESEAPDHGNGAGESDSARSSLGQSVNRRVENLEDGIDSLEGALARAKAKLDAQVARRPYATLAATLGVGYVIGGGLFTPFTARVLGGALKLAVRVAVLPLLQQELAVVAQEALGLKDPPTA